MENKQESFKQAIPILHNLLPAWLEPAEHAYLLLNREFYQRRPEYLAAAATRSNNKQLARELVLRMRERILSLRGFATTESAQQQCYALMQQLDHFLGFDNEVIYLSTFASCMALKIGLLIRLGIATDEHLRFLANVARDDIMTDVIIACEPLFDGLHDDATNLLVNAGFDLIARLTLEERNIIRNVWHALAVCCNPNRLLSIMYELLYVMMHNGYVSCQNATFAFEALLQNNNLFAYCTPEIADEIARMGVWPLHREHLPLIDLLTEVNHDVFLYRHDIMHALIDEVTVYRTRSSSLHFLEVLARQTPWLFHGLTAILSENLFELISNRYIYRPEKKNILTILVLLADNFPEVKRYLSNYCENVIACTRLDGLQALILQPEILPRDATGRLIEKLTQLAVPDSMLSLLPFGWSSALNIRILALEALAIFIKRMPQADLSRARRTFRNPVPILIDEMRRNSDNKLADHIASTLENLAKSSLTLFNDLAVDDLLNMYRSNLLQVIPPLGILLCQKRFARKVQASNINLALGFYTHHNFAIYQLRNEKFIDLMLTYYPQFFGREQILVLLAEINHIPFNRSLEFLLRISLTAPQAFTATERVLIERGLTERFQYAFSTRELAFMMSLCVKSPLFTPEGLYMLVRPELTNRVVSSRKIALYTLAKVLPDLEPSLINDAFSILQQLLNDADAQVKLIAFTLLAKFRKIEPADNSGFTLISDAVNATGVRVIHSLQPLFNNYHARIASNDSETSPLASNSFFRTRLRPAETTPGAGFKFIHK